VSTTGPPLFPGFRAPSIKTATSFPCSFRLMLDTLPLPTTTVGRPRSGASAWPKGNPKTYTGIVSTSVVSRVMSIGAGRSGTPVIRRMARSDSGEVATISAGRVRSGLVPLRSTTLIAAGLLNSPFGGLMT
jgi:hypothetical protein